VVQVSDETAPGLAMTTPTPDIGVESTVNIGVALASGDAPGVARGVPQTSNCPGVAVKSWAVVKEFAPNPAPIPIVATSPKPTTNFRIVSSPFTDAYRHA
jgi:hypothetical protein